MPTVDAAKGKPGVTVIRHLGCYFSVPQWWCQETGVRCSPVAGADALTGVLINVQTACDAANAFMERWVR